MNPREPMMRTDEELQRVTVGERRPHDAPITLVPSDPAWPDQFRREARRIGRALAGGVAAVEHVGSTSVPGLPAKPIIDIVVAVPDSADEATYVPALEAAGYVLRIREPHWHEHRMFNGPDVDTNVHVFTAGDSEVERMLAFRDRLRGDHQARERYAEAKRQLAPRRWRHIQHYADAKSGVIDEILASTR